MEIPRSNRGSRKIKSIPQGPRGISRNQLSPKLLKNPKNPPKNSICTAGTVNVRVAWSEWGFVSNYRFMMSFFFRDDCKLNHCSLIRFSQPIPVQHQNLNGRLLLKRRIADKIILKRMPVKSMASSYRLTVC